jgi:multiple sugar transport system substrate-binding protein
MSPQQISKRRFLGYMAGLAVGSVSLASCTSAPASSTPAPAVVIAPSTPAPTVVTAPSTPAPAVATAPSTPAPAVATAPSTPAPAVVTAPSTPAPAVVTQVVTPAAQAAPRPAIVSVTYWNYNGVAGAAEQKIADYWNDQMASDKKITLDLTVFPGNLFVAKTEAALAAGDAADIIFTSPVEMYARIQRGWFREVTDFIKRDINMADYFPETLPYVQFPPGSGKTFGLPRDWVVSTLSYDVGLFQKAGIAPPTDNWTWDDLHQTAAQLTKTSGGKTSQWGFVGYDTRPVFLERAWAEGARFVTDDHKAQVNSAPVLKAITFFADMLKDKSAAPPGSFVQGGPSPFATGTVGTAVDWCCSAADYKDSVADKFKYDFVRVPKGSVRQVNYGGPDTLAMSTSAKYVEETWEIMKFVTGTPVTPVVVEWFAERPGFLPFPKSIWNEKAVVDSAVSPNYRAAMINSTKDIDAEYTIGWSEWTAALASELQNVWLGKSSPKQALDAAQIEVQQILDKWYKA